MRERIIYILDILFLASSDIHEGKTEQFSNNKLYAQ